MKVKSNWLKKLHLYWLSKLEKTYSDRYYKSIEDLPVLNWWKLHEENDFKWLLKDSNKKITKHSIKIFKSIKSEFVEEFGIDRKYEEYLKKVWKLELIKIDIALSGDKSKKIFADILELEIEDLLNEQETKVHNHGVMHIEKFMGFKLNVKSTTVNEFYSYVKEIEKQLKQQKDNG
jgi:hypothetical protein